MKGDRSLDEVGKDRLGFSAVAQQVATSLATLVSDNGFVLGIEGKWGSGKSSLLFLIEQELTKLGAQGSVSVIPFRPWLIGNRDALLSAFFSALSERIAHAKGEGAIRRKYKSAALALQKFAAKLGEVGDVVGTAAETLGVPGGTAGGAITKAVGRLAAGKASPSLLKVKNDLVDSLRDLDHRFIVTIDDVDRLEPAEVIEVLRLTRSVADFPNVIYVLCYDSTILAHSIEQATGVQNGHDYLEKIVQMVVTVPAPEEFQLRRWFAQELATIAKPKTSDEDERLRAIIDADGGRRLKTPRSVVRTLDSLRFLWPALEKAGGDLADAVWLQLIKNDNVELYRWIENYCSTSAALSLNIARVTDHECAQSLQQITEFDKPAQHLKESTYRLLFSEQLLGCKHHFEEEENGVLLALHKEVHRSDLDKAIADKRLKSPDHYRLYFALSTPTHALSQQDFDAFWDATRNEKANQTAEILKNWHSTVLAPPLSKAEILLERLHSVAPDVLTSQQIKSIILAFADMMDIAFRLRPFQPFSPHRSIWDLAEKLLPRLLARFTEEERKENVKTAFQSGTAIGWLTQIFRHEIVAHGRYGSRREPESEWIFTDPEFDTIATIMKSRYATMTLNDILNTPESASLLHAWHQADGAREVAARLKDVMQNDQQLIALLECLTGVVSSSSEGLYKTLERKIVGRFVDFDAAKDRLEAISKSEPNSELALAAKKLLIAAEREDRDKRP
jgi:hypothetical protein